MGKIYRCDNCGKTQYSINSLLKIEDFSLRTEPGNEIPAGECPGCGALCYVVKPIDYLREAAPDLLEACENALWHLDPEHNSGRTTLRTDELVPFIQKAIAKAKGGE